MTRHDPNLAEGHPPAATCASPFHAGEQAIQHRLGVRDEIEPWARKVVRPCLPEEHREFYAQLPYVVVAARDEAGRPWATLLAGDPGFAASPEPRRLRLAARPARGDALEQALATGADVGLLGIELATRRRNRVNGRLVATSPEGLELIVDQSFGNCPQYITEREWVLDRETAPASARRHEVLTPEIQRRVRGADTFFIATGYRGEDESTSFGMDASHRGGEPGFVEVLDERTLRFPDYAGNNHFNTLGNLLLDPRVGLLFVDFATGGLLQLSGRARIDWDSPQVARHRGARRLVEITLEGPGSVVEIGQAVALRWRELADWRPLRVAEKVRESDDVTSFVLEAPDGAPLADFEPGQHLPIELPAAPVGEGPEGERLRRTYSLSTGPSTTRYRISVKREAHGRASRRLHDAIEVGDLLRARAPAGDFVLRPGARPVVLVSAGVGVTPMLGMLHALVDSEDPREVLFVHAARDGAHHPLSTEVRQLAARSPRVRVHVAYSQPRERDREGVDFDSRGRIDAHRVHVLAGRSDADFYLCGPGPFMASLEEGLRRRGVAPGHVYSESFGPVG